MMKGQLRYLARRLVLMMWRPARVREGERLLQQMAEAVRTVPSKHDDPAYSERFLRTVFSRPAGSQLPESPAGRTVVRGQDRSSLARLDVTIDAWLAVVSLHSPIPGGMHLPDLLRQFAGELADQANDVPRVARTPHDIGYQLATSLHIDQVSFRRTIELLTPFLKTALPPSAGPRAAEPADGHIPRWVSVLAGLVEGYTAGTRDRALGEQATLVAALSTACAQRQRELVDDVDRFGELFSGSLTAMALLDPAGRIVEVNTALASALNRSMQTLHGTDLTLYFGVDAHPLVAEHLFAAIHAGHSVGSVPACPLAPTEQDPPRWVRLHWAMPRQGGDRIHVVLEDVTAHHLVQHWLAHLAGHDHLTGVPNRRYLEDRLEHLLSDSPNNGTVGVYAIRLDGLADITAAFGPGATSVAVHELTARTLNAAATTDLIAQLDPTTFAIIITRPENWTTATETIKRLVDRLADPLPIAEPRAVCISPTVAAARGIPGRTTVDDLLDRLDRSLLRATAHDRAIVVEAPRRDHDQERNQLVAELPAAIDAGEVTILHAPIARAATGQIVGAHAIPSWTDPHDRAVPVTELINLATAIGLSTPIVPWCLDQALAHAATWRATLGGHAPFLRIDLPAQCTLDEELVDEILAALTKHHFPAAQLQLAVWESSIINARDELTREVLRLNTAGVRLCLNDLGAGVGRFDLLPQLYLHCVSIAAHLTAELETIPRQGKPTTLQAMIQWATYLKVDIDLPNINNDHEKELARRHGATNIQGHVVGDPQTPAELERLIQEVRGRPCAVST